MPSVSCAFRNPGSSVAELTRPSGVVAWPEARAMTGIIYESTPGTFMDQNTSAPAKSPESQLAQLGALCDSRQVAVATAESCTAGALGAYLTSRPGGSAWFLGGIVCYQNAVKAELLGVDRALVDRCGVVSAEVALAMAQGLARHFPGALCLSVTGWLDNAPELDECTGEFVLAPAPAVDRVYQHAPDQRAPGTKESVAAGNVWMCVCGKPDPSGGLSGDSPRQCREQRLRLSCAGRDRRQLRDLVCVEAVRLLISAFD